MLAEVKHRSTGGHCKTNGAHVDAPTREQLLALPEAPALVARLKTQVRPDWEGRDEHAELVAALILRVRHAAASRNDRHGPHHPDGATRAVAEEVSA